MSLDLPSPELLRNMLDYDPDTGHLVWKQRSLDMFNAFPDPELALCIFKKRIGKRALNTKMSGYLRGRLFLHPIKDRDFLAHRVAWVMMTDKPLHPLAVVRHINGVRDDNRFLNLKIEGGLGQ